MLFYLILVHTCEVSLALLLHRRCMYTLCISTPQRTRPCTDSWCYCLHVLVYLYIAMYICIVDRYHRLGQKLYLRRCPEQKHCCDFSCVNTFMLRLFQTTLATSCYYYLHVIGCHELFTGRKFGTDFEIWDKYAKTSLKTCWDE